METRVIDRGKRIRSGIVSLVVLVIIFFGIFPQLGNYSDAFDLINRMAFGGVTLLVAFTLLNILIYTFPFMAAVPGLGFGPGFILRQTYFVLSNAIPGGGALGIGVQIVMMRDYGYNAAAASSAIVLTGVWNMQATVVLPGIAALGLLLSGQLSSSNAIAAAISITVAALSITGLYLIFRSQNLARKLGSLADTAIKRLAIWIKRPMHADVTKQVMSFRATSYEIMTNRWQVLAGSNLLQQLSQFSVLYVALEILEPGAITFLQALGVFAFGRLGTFIPLTPGGVGTVDAILLSLLVDAGVSSDAALAATLIWRMATFLPQMFVGAATFAYWRLRVTPQKL